MSAVQAPVMSLSNLTEVYPTHAASTIDGACCVRPAVSVGIFPDPMHITSMQQQLHERPAHLVPTITNGATP